MGYGREDQFIRNHKLNIKAEAITIAPSAKVFAE